MTDKERVERCCLSVNKISSFFFFFAPFWNESLFTKQSALIQQIWKVGSCVTQLEVELKDKSCFLIKAQRGTKCSDSPLYFSKLSVLLYPNHTVVIYFNTFEGLPGVSGCSVIYNQCYRLLVVHSDEEYK